MDKVNYQIQNLLLGIWASRSSKIYSRHVKSRQIPKWFWFGLAISTLFSEQARPNVPVSNTMLFHGTDVGDIGLMLVIAFNV